MHGDDPVLEWGDLTDTEYRAKRAESQRQLALLPDADKLVVFDRNRHVMTSMAANVAAATPAQKRELVALLVEAVVANEATVEPHAITWTAPGTAVLRGPLVGVPQGPFWGAQTNRPRTLRRLTP